MSASVAEALQLALTEKPIAFGIEVTDHQLRYAMKVSNKVAAYYNDHPVLARDDLKQIGIEAILTELHDHPHLGTYNAWMGKVAKWAMVDELRKINGRRGKTRTGKDRMMRPEQCDEIMPAAGKTYDEYDPALYTDWVLDRLTERQRQIVSLLLRDYSKTEVAKVLHVSQPSITLTLKAAKTRLLACGINAERIMGL